MINVRAEQLKVLASANEEEFITADGGRGEASMSPTSGSGRSSGRPVIGAWPFRAPAARPLLALLLAQRARHQQPDPLGEIAHRRIGELRVESRMVILPPLQ